MLFSSCETKEWMQEKLPGSLCVEESFAFSKKLEVEERKSTYGFPLYCESQKPTDLQ